MKKTVIIFLLCMRICNGIESYGASGLSQILGGNAFLQGDFVEVAIGPCGNFASTINAPSGFHPRGLGSSSSNNQLGFIANPTKDNWTNYIGDYFLPGTPEEGFGLSINGANYNNNMICMVTDIPGSNISVQSTLSEEFAIWQGTIGGLLINAKTYIPTGAVYFVTEVTLTNTTTSPINDIYYMRNVDPDHGVLTPGSSGSYHTYNSIVYQNPNLCNKALVSATTLSGGGDYLGLGSIDSRAKVTRGGFSNRSASDVWNGVTPLSLVGTDCYFDEAISISFNIGTLNPNESTTFAYVYILKETDLDQALAATNFGLTVSAPTTTICEGDTLTFTATPTSVGVSPVYQWKVNNINVGTNSNIFSTSLLQNNDEVSCSMTSGTACSLATTVVSNDVKITVKNISKTTQIVKVCQTNLPYLWHGRTYNSACTDTIYLTNSIGCDSLVILKLNISGTTSIIDTTICATSLPYIWNGNSYSTSASDTIHIMNMDGCDSIAILNLTVVTFVTPSISISANVTNACVDSIVTFTAISSGGGSAPIYQWKVNNINVGVNGTTYSSNSLVNSDIVSCNLISNASCAIFSTANSNQITMKVSPSTTSTTNLTLCTTYLPYAWNGISCSTAGTYTAYLKNNAGCDSVATMVLGLKSPTSSFTSATICQGDSYTFSGTTYTTSGTYTANLTNAVGCDSLATLQLTVLATSSSITSVSICNTSLPYVWNGTSYTTSGTYTAHLTNAVGCDSLATLQLTVLATSSSLTNVSICYTALPYVWNGTSYSTSGTYTTHFINAVGCDSTATLVLEADPSISTTAQSICQGESYIFNGTSYTTTGTYTAHLINSKGCDSTDILILTVNQPTSYTITETICEGTSYFVNGTAYTTAGTYIVHLINAAGCDSTVTLQLSIIQSKHVAISEDICANEFYHLGSQILNKTGIYTERFTSNAGCDSLVTLTLTVKPIYIYSQNIHLLYKETYFINGHVYKKDGRYVDVFKAENGCDSTIITIIDISYTNCPEIIIPKFFTPNGDGFNDYFEVENISCYLKSTIDIYDRFGRLLVHYTGTDVGWDGIYQGNKMPSTDYWYIIAINDTGKRFVGHFLLER